MATESSVDTQLVEGVRIELLFYMVYLISCLEVRSTAQRKCD